MISSEREDTSMLKTILVPLDGSSLSEHALPYATRLACGTGARLVLVQATSPAPLPGESTRAAPETTAQEAEVKLAVLVNRLRSEGVGAEARVSDEDAATAIRHATADEGADVIVMSTHGRGGLGRWIYGSVADRMLQTALVPVLLVPAACSARWPADRPLRILVPLDGSSIAEEALDLARALAELGGLELHLLRVVEPLAPIEPYGGYVPPLVDDSALDTARQYLERIATPLRTSGRMVTVRVATGGPAAQISAAARDQQVDLIVLATHGRGGVTRLVMGSVAADVLRQASVPILMARPAAVRAAAESPATEPRPLDGPAALVPLNRRELALIQQALTAELRDAEREAGARVHAGAGGQELSDLLARLQQAAPVVAGRHA
jgi:nucleotide-binding universal stress UspA family protein